jgi:hypothetical protein
MNKASLKDVSPLVDLITQHAQTLIDDEDVICANLFKEQDVLIPFASKITMLTKAFKTASSGKSPEEIVTLCSAVIDKIDQTINLHFQEMKIKNLISNSKKSGFVELKQKIVDAYATSLGDADRIDEVIALIESGNEPAVGKKRKMGTRPEKLSVVRRAEDIINQKKDESSQAGE